jgi:xylulokinase
VHADQALLIYGSTACLVLSVAGSAQSCSGLGLCPHCIPGLTLLVGATSTSGSALDWLVDTVFSPLYPQQPSIAQQGAGAAMEVRSDMSSVYAVLNSQADAVPPGCRSVMVFPHLKGMRAPVRDANARGVILGLTLSTKREELYRAFLEGIAYDVRTIVDAARSHAAVPRRLAATGGGSANSLLVQVVSDVLQREQTVFHRSSAARGAACLAGLGVGLVSGTHAIEQEWAGSDGSSIAPRSEAKSAYDNCYALFRTLQGTMRSATASLGVCDEGIAGSIRSQKARTEMQ